MVEPQAIQEKKDMSQLKNKQLSKFLGLVK